MPEFVSQRPRDAWGPIRGYVYQVDLTIDRWLNLRPDQVLELERGEDIDTIQEAVQIKGVENTRLLEQIKVRESSLTLRSTHAIEALASFYEHLDVNPQLDLNFRYVTTADIGLEHNSPSPDRIPLITLWDQLRSGISDESERKAGLDIIKGFLVTLKKPQGLANSTWDRFSSFVKSIDNNGLLSFIEKVEWLTQNTPFEEVRQQIQQTLTTKYQVPPEKAPSIYSTLFLHVFKLISHPDVKRLTASELAILLTTPTLSRSDEVLLANLNANLSGLYERMFALEESVVKLHPHSLQTADETRALLRAYVEELAVQRPYVFWGDEVYVERSVTEPQELLQVNVKPYKKSEKKDETQSSPLMLEQVLTKEKNVVLIGEPGLGKTTSLLHLTLKAARQAAVTSLDEEKGADHSSDLIPIHIELKYFEGELDLAHMFARKVEEILGARGLTLSPELAESAKILRGWLGNNKLRFFLLLDGLNEVPNKHRLRLRGLITALLRSPHRVVVSCRERDYDDSYQDLAPAFVLEGLQAEQIYRYLRGRLGDKGGLLFINEIRPDEKMLTLATNPLALSLIATVAGANWTEIDSDKSLPVSRGKLFEAFVDIMPRLRQADGFGPSVPPDVVLKAISKLAFEMHDRQRLAAKAGEVRTWLAESTGGYMIEEVLSQAKDWRVLKADGRTGEQIEFLHQLFLEYFTAVHLHNDLLLGYDFASVLGQRHLNERWFEVIEMLAGVIESPTGLVSWLCVEAMKERSGETALLACRCLTPGDLTDDSTVRSKVVDALISTLKDTAGATQEDIAWTLGELGDMRAVGALLEEMVTVSSHSLEGLRRGAEDNEDWASLRRLEDTYESGYVLMVHALGKLGDKNVVPRLIDLLLDDDEFPLVREQAAESLGMLQDERATKPLITVLTDIDSKYDLRNSAADALGMLQAELALEPLLNMLAEGNNKTVHNVVNALGKLGHPRARPLLLALREQELKEAVLAQDEYLLEEIDHDEYLLEEIEEALVGILKRRDSEPLLALTDPDAEVRRQAACMLGEEGDITALPRLRKVAKSDSAVTLFGSVAEAAREAIKKIEDREARKSRTIR